MLPIEEKQLREELLRLRLLDSAMRVGLIAAKSALTTGKDKELALMAVEKALAEAGSVAPKGKDE